MTIWIWWIELLFQLPSLPSKATTSKGTRSTITAVVICHLVESSLLSASLPTGVAVRWREVSVGSQADVQGNKNGSSDRKKGICSDTTERQTREIQ